MIKNAMLGFAVVVFAPVNAQAASQPVVPGIPMADVQGGKNLSCATFSHLDAAVATRVLYYINGYAAGVEDQIAAGTPNSSSADNTKVAPSPGPTSTQPTTPTAMPANPKSDGIGSMAGLEGITLDQLKAVCLSQPRATVLSVMPGGQPVTANGTISGQAGGGANGTSTTSGGGNTGVVGGQNNTVGTGVSSTPPAVPTPTNGTVTTNPQTGLSTVTSGSPSMIVPAAPTSGTPAAGATAGATAAGAPAGGK
jgi:hypothetical protein